MTDISEVSGIEHSITKKTDFASEHQKAMADLKKVKQEIDDLENLSDTSKVSKKKEKKSKKSKRRDHSSDSDSEKSYHRKRSRRDPYPA